MAPIKNERKINDSLFRLYSPPTGRPVTADIIFFHGLQPASSVYTDGYWNTWSSDGGDTAWPQKVLGEQVFLDARIFSISYDSAVEKSPRSGRGDMFKIAENLVQDIIESDARAEGSQLPLGQLPIVLVGHSLGGLVIKKFLLRTCEMINYLDPEEEQDKEKISKFNGFVKNVRGIFYYSTPHHGTTLADVAGRIPADRTSAVLIFLKTLSEETERLNEDFRKWRKIKKIKAATIGENFPTSFSIFGVKGRLSQQIVVEASARADSEGFYTVDANHIDVCKPGKSRDGNVYEQTDVQTDNRFINLKNFITTNIPVLIRSEPEVDLR